MRRGLRYLGRNWNFVLVFPSCGAAAGAVLAGGRMPWWAQLAWIGTAALWAANAAFERSLARRRAEQLRLGLRPTMCMMSGCPVRLNGHLGRFSQLTHDLWTWSPN